MKRRAPEDLNSGYRWKCACGYDTTWVSHHDDLNTRIQDHRSIHFAQLKRITNAWDGKHYSTCPYECDCPDWARIPA